MLTITGVTFKGPVLGACCMFHISRSGFLRASRAMDEYEPKLNTDATFGCISRALRQCFCYPHLCSFKASRSGRNGRISSLIQTNTVNAILEHILELAGLSRLSNPSREERKIYHGQNSFFVLGFQGTVIICGSFP